MEKRKGVLILTEGRSGSNWLGSLATGAGLGRSGEWLGREQSQLDPVLTDRKTYFEAAIENGTNGSSGFCIKIFPRHLHWINHYYNKDFIRYCRENHDVSLVLLTRNDRLRQAISFSRGLQTEQWTSKGEKKKDADYDFDQICRCYFLINRSYDYWRSYTGVISEDIQHFIYEDLLDDPSPFVNHIADHFGVTHPTKLESSLTVQRDETTEKWRVRFLEEAKTRDFIDSTTPSRLPGRSPRNLIRFLRKKPLSPYPYAY
ncbi:Stf0 family sulfotransferase [Celeribacter sp.]|uniref:Stf0 family sulfotransferase n=1 Tax=Celeribacter sp. TaxID=1890673 RepID=UPI003A8E932C